MIQIGPLRSLKADDGSWSVVVQEGSLSPLKTGLTQEGAEGLMEAIVSLIDAVPGWRMAKPSPRKADHAVEPTAGVGSDKSDRMEIALEGIRSNCVCWLAGIDTNVTNPDQRLLMTLELATFGLK